MWPRPFEVGLVIARTANQSNKIDFRRHIWLSVADQVTASLVRAPWTGFESRMEVCPQDIDNTEIFLADDAVTTEPVSAPAFPGNSENNREIWQEGPPLPQFDARLHNKHNELEVHFPVDLFREIISRNRVMYVPITVPSAKVFIYGERRLMQSR